MRKDKKRRVLAGLVCGSMLTVALVGGTFAYLQYEDSDVNVMTLGNVQIDQREYERELNADGSYKTDTIDGQTSYVLDKENYTQGKPLLPIVGDPNEPGDSDAYAGWDDTIVRMTQVGSYGSMQVFAGKNAQDKFVTVENTGKSDAYVRTLVAIEVGSTDGSLIMTSSRAQEADATGTQPWIVSSAGQINIDGNNYNVYEYVYRGASDVNRHVNGVLPAGETTYPNLCQVYLKHNATNEDMEAIDGNDNGMLDIRVLSQAVQADGFADAQTALNTAFGKTSEKAAEWFAGMKATETASSFDELDSALQRGSNVELDGDIEGGALSITSDGTQLNGNGNALSATYVEINGSAEVEDITMNVGTSTDYGNILRDGAVVTYDNVNIVSGGGGVGVTGGAKAIFNSSSVYVDSTSTSARYVFYATGEGSVIEINGGEFSWDKSDNQKRAYIYADAGTEVYVNGGTFGKASTRSGYTAGIMGTGTVIIKGGTFGFDPSAWVAEGYEAVKSGSTWTVSAVQ